jgi:hypothetical protein
VKFRTLAYLPAYGLGLWLALSGTGLVFTILFTLIPIAALVIPMLADRKKALFILFASVIAACIFFTVFPYDYFLYRTHELTSPTASGFIRFTGNFIAFGNFLDSDPLRVVFGFGPGTSGPMLSGFVFPSCWIKLLYEYGFAGLITFSIFFWYCVWSSTRSRFLTVAFVFHFLFLDGNLLVIQHVFVAFLIYGLPRAQGGMSKTIAIEQNYRY